MIGALLAGLSFLAIYQSNGGNLSDWKQWLIPTLIAVLGYLSKDAGVTGSLKILLAGLCLLGVPACEQMKAFIVANEPLIEETIVYGVRTSVKAGVKKLEPKTAAKNPVEVNP